MDINVVNMNKPLFTVIAWLMLSACTPGYQWVNTDYPLPEMKDHFAMDKGDCIREADATYPDPYPVADPDELYYECMAQTSRRETYPVKAEDGTTVYRTVMTRGNPYVCRPTREEQQYYREYENYLRQQRNERAQYVNSCLAIMGWEKIQIVEEQ